MQGPQLAPCSIFPQSLKEPKWPVMPVERLCSPFKSLQVKMNQLYLKAREPPQPKVHVNGWITLICS